MISMERLDALDNLSVALIVPPWMTFALVTCAFTFPPPALAWRAIGYAVAATAVAAACACLGAHAAGPPQAVKPAPHDPGGGFPLSLLPRPSAPPRSALLYVGLLCLTAAVAGWVAGQHLFLRYMLQYWRQHNLLTYTGVAPSEPAAAFSDAVNIQFSDSARVDQHRVLGVNSQPSGGTTYCVAPIVDDARRHKIEFWAVGEDCCEPRQNFRCGGDATAPGAHWGAVVSPSAFSADAASTHRRFLDAARRAAVLHRTWASDEPVLVRWAEEKVAGGGYLCGALLWAVLLCLLHLVASVAAATQLLRQRTSPLAAASAWFEGMLR
mmetsp:Transcript_14628/g.41812  ORF Transcript_14628/g.41812 Transcript_14628/m.41812 type:complete len:324 (+) Transcript_14628:143-1114(+)